MREAITRTLSAAGVLSSDSVIREYIAARNAYEDATKRPNSHAPEPRLSHGDPRILRYRKAREALNELLASEAGDVNVGEPSAEMGRDEAIRVLTQHNAWRRGGIGTPTDPEKLSLALDSAIALLRNTRSSEEPSADTRRMDWIDENAWALEVAGGKRITTNMGLNRSAIDEAMENRNG